MNGWQRWLQAPQTHWLRRALFQVHLWAGIGLGLYVLIISLSGSALLLKYRFYDWFEPKSVHPEAAAVALEGDALKARLVEVYAGYEVGFTVESVDREHATYVVLNKDSKVFPHYFDQFSGTDLGASNPWPIKAVETLADMHAELFLGRPTGRQVNGIGGVLFVLMSLTGLIIWWQGRARWYEAFIINPFSKRSLWWQFHTCIGFWSLLLMVAWGVSGFQLGFPQATNSIVNFLDTDTTDNIRPTSWLRFFRTVHFARFGETSFTRWCWIIVSFLPTLMVLSGVVVWWRRVVWPRVKRRQVPH